MNLINEFKVHVSLKIYLFVSYIEGINSFKHPFAFDMLSKIWKNNIDGSQWLIKCLILEFFLLIVNAIS